MKTTDFFYTGMKHALEIVHNTDSVQLDLQYSRALWRDIAESKVLGRQVHTQQHKTPSHKRFHVTRYIARIMDKERG